MSPEDETHGTRIDGSMERSQQFYEESNWEQEDDGESLQRPTVRVVKELITNNVAVLSILVIAVFVLSSVFAPQVAPAGPEESFGLLEPPLSSSQVDIDNDGQDEQFLHILGTDSFGQDIFSRVIYGSRISLIVAFATLAVSLTIGTAIGIVAGYYGGLIDTVLMRYIDFQWAFPELILAVALIGYLGDTGLINVVVAIGIAFIDDFARIIRGEILSLREEEYVLAARAIGMQDRRIMASEMLPNAMAPIIVQATFLVPLAILAEAGLSFLGIGVSVTEPTWGLMVSEGRNFLTQAWWVSIMPGFAIMITVLAFNLLGDRLRDIMDISDQEVQEGGAA
jgi:ABC-type dipeptide/oligopeptide/nickel transport system permease subunit